MYNKPLKTKFAPAERVNKELLEKQAKIFSKNEILINLANSISQMLLILNKERQIVFANNLFLVWLRIDEINDIIGKRPGEATNCIYSNINEGRCGTSEFCRTCGAINSILESQRGIQSTKECRILTSENDALDLRVTSTPYEYGDEKFTLFSIMDISHEKRRETLERVFFHDVLNSAGGIAGLSNVLQEIKDQNEITGIAKIIKRAAENMIEEIQSQRQIGAAERGDLVINSEEINSISVMNDVKELYANHEITKDKNIKINPTSDDVTISSDKILIRRILGNMLKNALEATLPESTVTLTCQSENTKVKFSVHNDSFIPSEIQHQLFQRSFSTKGPGRGIGTYSMKLFGEKYLKGKVWFKSTLQEGTTFFIELNSVTTD